MMTNHPKPRTSLSLRAAIVCGLFVAGMVLLPFTNRADARALRAQVYMTQTPVPARLSERSLLAFARRASTKTLRESTEPLPQDRKWIGDLIFAFNGAPGDLEFHVLFYDVEDGSRRFLEDMSVMVNDRTQKTYVQRFRLPRPRFKANRRYEAVVTVQRAEVGSYKFATVGETIRRDGNISFSDDDTRAREE